MLLVHSNLKTLAARENSVRQFGAAANCTGPGVDLSRC